MKRILSGALLIMLMSSCSMFRTSTSTTMQVDSSLTSVTTADLQVSDTKISYTYYPKKQDRKAGLGHVISNATAAALKENGNADILVERQYEAVFKSRLLRTRTSKYNLLNSPKT